MTDSSLALGNLTLLVYRRQERRCHDCSSKIALDEAKLVRLDGDQEMSYANALIICPSCQQRRSRPRRRQRRKET